MSKITKEYKLNGKLHREDGPAIEWADGDKHWYLNGKLHREDGPATEFANGTKAWFLNGQRHRENGPAVEFAGGTKEWFLNGKPLTEEQFKFKKATESKEIDTTKQSLEQLNVKTANELIRKLNELLQKPMTE